MKKQKILYVHGFNSSGSTGRTMKEIFSDYEVYAPPIPEKFNEAKSFIEKFVDDNKIDLVIGTSLGAFITLNLSNEVKRIVINPTFDPYNDLQPLDAPKEVYGSYKGHAIYDDAIKKITFFKLENTYGMFGGSDPLFSYYRFFKQIFPEKHTYYVPTMEHQIKSIEIEKDLKPLVDFLLN